MTNYKLNFEKRLKGLNEKQRLAVDTTDGAVLVLAGPGTGKTELLALRCANIINLGLALPSNILLLTFTESGAANMRDRLHSIIGEASYKVAIYTFHSFASQILERYAENFWNGAVFRVATDLERLNLIEKVLTNLSRDFKLSVKNYEKGFVYTNDVIANIAGLKKGNISPQEYLDLIKKTENEMKKINEFAGEIIAESSGKSKWNLINDAYSKLFQELQKESENDNTYAKFLVATLELAYVEANETEDGKILNKWRDEYFSKDDEAGIKILKDSAKDKIKKWYELAVIYTNYQNELIASSIYDYEDMLYMVTREIGRNTNLRNELEEKYQYIMVDEFQDTNDAQLNLVLNLTSSPVNEGDPNILVVGDDDQAIYKFQGAELDNITKFSSTYKKLKTIVLDSNYRSTQDILDYARNIILKAGDRLETRNKQITKELKSSNEEIKKINTGKIIECSFTNEIDEFEFIANKVKELIESGVEPSEISVIAKKHNSLRDLSNIFNIHSLPYSYEKKEHVLDKKPIHELVTILRFVESGLNAQTPLREDLLPEILSYKFWNLERLDIWNLANMVKSGSKVMNDAGIEEYVRLNWLDAMLTSENTKINSIARFLVELIADAQEITLEQLIDKVIGTKEYEYQGEYDDEYISNSDTRPHDNFVSPFRNYYFGEGNFKKNKTEYLDFLFALRTFIGTLREFKRGEILKTKDIIEFLNVYTGNDNLTLTTNSPLATSENAVILQTAHKAKGLEYPYVFIINADEKTWNGRGRNNLISFPKNIKLLPETDSEDDKIRLFYVSATRAKHTLYITHHDKKVSFVMSENSKLNIEIQNNESENRNIDLSETQLQSLSINKSNPLINDEKILLKRLLENYQMPVTHLTNFLNLDKVGPSKFIEQNLLRFPQAMSSSSVYGSAMHNAMQYYFLYFKKNNKTPNIEELHNFYEKSLSSGGLSTSEFLKYLESGKKNLDIYIKYLNQNELDLNDLVECNFAREGVNLGDVHASGKIDKMHFVQNDIEVTDLKTGKSYNTWTPKGASNYEKIKLHFYQYQLAFYKLLIKNSRSFNNYDVRVGKIEFIEADEAGKINTLELELSNELVERVEKLAKVIWSKIHDLEFPDTTKWTHDEYGNEKEIKLDDILEFEEELLKEYI